MKLTTGTLLLAAGLLIGAPSRYSVQKAIDFTPVIDGSLNEWPESALIDSLRGDQNVFARTATTAWTRDEFQMKVYAAYDSQWVYYAVKVVSDNVLQLPDSTGPVTSGDNLKVNPGGQAMGFYISANGQVKLNPSSPFVLNSTLKARATRYSTPGNLPYYEFAIKRTTIDPFGMKQFQLAVGTEDTDNRSATDLCYAAVGVDYTGDKQAWNANPWDNPSYFPSFKLTDGTIVVPPPAQTVPTVFWFNAKKNGYDLGRQFRMADSSVLGPNLPTGVVVREGMIASGSIAQHTGATDAGFALGNGLDGVQGRSAFVWVKELNHLQGKVTSAKVRGEYRDIWSGNAFCNAGPISVRVGVVDFSGNISTYGGEASIPANASWMDAVNPLGINMGYDSKTATLMAQKTVTVQAPAGIQSASGYAVLEGKFFQIDVTDQVNWILSHTGANRGAYSGQYAIVLLTQPGDGTTGKVNLYADENDQTIGTANAWIKDGNSLHLLANVEVAQTVSMNDSANCTRVVIPATTTVANPVITIKADSTPVYGSTLSKLLSVEVKLDAELAAALNSATLTFDYSKYPVNGSAKNLRVYYLNGAQWDSVGGVVDTVAKTVTVVVTHFSTYGLMAPVVITTSCESGVAESFEALSALPNPFNPATVVRFSTLEKGAVSLNVYDVRGNRVRTLFQGEAAKGSQSVAFNAKDDAGRPLSSGIYFVRLQAGSRILMKQVQLMK